ncbi:MAG: cupin domain-containing protein [Candidatus Thorarchaeota archaeon]|jgi:quercetin dioxygenase-like cupin family protein
MTDIGFPDLIKNLPKAKLNFPGVTARIVQGKNEQVGFFEIEAGGVVKPHSHNEQYGFVIHGELELTIGEDTRVYKKGDSYHIPKGVVHSAETKTFVRVMDVFADVDRYQTE